MSSSLRDSCEGSKIGAAEVNSRNLKTKIQVFTDGTRLGAAIRISGVEAAIEVNDSFAG